MHAANPTRSVACRMCAQRSPSGKDRRSGVLFNPANSAFWKRLAHLLNTDRPGEYVEQSTHTRPISGTTRVSRYQKGKTNLEFAEARDSEWQWHHCMQVCISLQTDNHARTPPLSFLQAGCPSCHPTNSIKALKALRNSVHSV